MGWGVEAALLRSAVAVCCRGFFRRGNAEEKRACASAMFAFPSLSLWSFHRKETGERGRDGGVGGTWAVFDSKRVAAHSVIAKPPTRRDSSVTPATRAARARNGERGRGEREDRGRKRKGRHQPEERTSGNASAYQRRTMPRTISGCPAIGRCRCHTPGKREERSKRKRTTKKRLSLLFCCRLVFSLSVPLRRSARVSSLSIARMGYICPAPGLLRSRSALVGKTARPPPPN